ncbi:MAG: hypothetical protein AB3N17_07090 [Tateyamaria sp.]
MSKKAYFAASIVAAAIAASAPVWAEQPETRVLRIPAGLCEDFKASLIKWASRTRGHAAYAVPVVPRGSNYTCDNPGPVIPAAFSFNYDSQPPADRRARTDCNVTKPEGYRNCVVIGRAAPASK